MGKREGKDGFKVTKNTKCCDNHFRPDEITHVPGGTRWSLKLNATPIKVGCKPSDLDGLKRKQPADRVIDSRDNSKRQCFVDTVWSCSTEKYYQPKPLSRIAVNAVKNAYIVLKEENKELKSKVKALQKTIEDKELQLNKKTFGVNIIENNTELCRHYTGLPDFDRVKACLKFLDVGEKGENVIMKGSKGTGSTGRPRCLSVENQFLLALVKLRRGFSNAHCAFLFDCSESTVVNVFSSWLNYMFLKFTVLPIWISREEINTSMPCSFKAAFPRTRAIIDCTEIFVEAPESLHLRSMYYSDYKHHNTYKAFISITPAGSLSFVSELFPGSVSDREIVERCGFLRQEMWDKGDEVMADKGFTIRDLLGPLGVKLNMPHFLEDNLQFTTNQDPIISVK
ncbi:hypothetical protein AC249_AIPGENE18583 [Exaiptasia diaphana]|nr:hypothetical protein AC249_AIPGENE18583 [Exaiptasia diaphana]